MKKSEYYQGDVLRFFEGKPLELALYEQFFLKMEAAFPEATVKVQKTQISFYGKHLFAAASLPIRRKKGWPEHCLLVTFGLFTRVESPRIAVATEPYPGRWTHHVLVWEEGQIDEELMEWLRRSFDFSERK